jgi:hypothetical protein
MNVPVLGQHDHRWAGQRLGTKDGTTLASHGCLICCITMMWRAFNPDSSILPNQVDDIFTNQAGYAQGNLVIWGRIVQLVPNTNLLATEFTPTVHANIDHIKQALDAGQLVILEVRWHGNPAAQHYVIAVGHNGDDIIVNDPESGSRVGFSSKYFGSGNSAVDILAARYFAPVNPVSVPVSAAVSTPAPAPVVTQGVPQVTQAEHDASIAAVQTQLDSAKAELNVRDSMITSLNATIQNLRETTDSLMAELSATSGWQHTYIADRLDRVTKEEVAPIDFSGKVTVDPVAAGLVIEQAGTFQFDGTTYARTVKAEAGDYWLGIPVDSLSEGSLPVSSDATPAQQAAHVLDLRAQAVALNTSQKTHLAAAGAYGVVSKIAASITNLFKRSK